MRPPVVQRPTSPERGWGALLPPWRSWRRPPLATWADLVALGWGGGLRAAPPPSCGATALAMARAESHGLGCCAQGPSRSPPAGLFTRGAAPRHPESRAPGDPPHRRRHRRLWAPAPAQQPRKLVCIALVMFGLAAVHGLPVQRLSPDAREPWVSTHVGQPVPGIATVDRHDLTRQLGWPFRYEAPPYPPPGSGGTRPCCGRGERCPNQMGVAGWRSACGLLFCWRLFRPRQPTTAGCQRNPRRFTFERD
jgi:hypothetical protein